MHTRHIQVAAVLLLVAAVLPNGCAAVRNGPTTARLHLTTSQESYKPVFVLHGINSGAKIMDRLVDMIQKGHPGQNVVNLAVFQDIPGSLEPLHYQVEKIADKISSLVASDPALYQDGYHLLCHSQGATICRCLAQYMDDHHINTLVSMAGPQMGVYDEHYLELFGLKGKLANTTFEDLYKVAYTELFQDTTSMANLWHDPTHEPEYLSKNVFLPVFNGLVGNATGFKRNLVRVQKAAFLIGDIGDEFDGGVGPWQSGVWGFYNQTTESFISMKETRLYKEDLIGLKTLDEEGRLIVRSYKGIDHMDWIFDETTVTSIVLPLIA